MKPITNTRDDLIERFAIEIGAERPEAVQPKRIRTKVRKQTIASGHPVPCSVGKLSSAGR
jgi:hypothetical protein